MWKDLTLKQKAEIMKMSVANGVTDINDIQQLYDNSVGHRFDNAGKIITTSGSGYFPPIKPEAVIDAAFNYAIGDGKIPIDVVRKRLYDNLYPYSYTSPVTRVHNAVVNNKKEPRIVRNIPDRDDIFAEYLQIPKNERHRLPGTMYVRDSEYAPTMGGTNNVKYKKLDLTDAQKEKIILATNSLNFGENRLSKIKHKFDEAKSKPRKYTDTQAAAMVLNSYFGEYTLGKGLDPQKGEYRSYYDLWDLSPVSTYGKDETRGIGKPVPFYDRIYLDDYYGVDSRPWRTENEPGYYGGYLPEIVVTNKRALGGHLYKNAGQLDKAKDQSKYQYGIIEQILRENGVNFRVTSGARKPNQAGNAGKSSAHTYTIFGGSPGAIDIVPGVGSDWNTLFAQISSPEVKKALAAYGLDILNETNPSVMASTKATGPHLHVGRGIKGQQGLGQIFGGTSYGGGRGNTYRLQYPSQRNSDYTPMYSQNAFEPIVIGGNNTSNPWLDYIRNVESIGNQGINPVFNTPIRPTNTGLNGIKSTFTPTDFSSLSNSSDVVSPLEPYAAKQNIEYGLGLEGNALWNSPYLMFDNHSAANGGHLFGTAGQMLIRDNAVNPALRYVYGDDYEEYIRQLRNYRPANIERRVKPRYNLSQQTDVVGNTARPVNKSIKNKQINSPQRQQKEQKLANDRYWQNERKRQGTISQASNVPRDPVYNREFANEVQALREREAEEAKKRYPVDLAMKQGLEFAGEAMRPLFITSDIGALFDPNTRSVGDFFANIWSPNNKGIFNINQGLRSWYDANPELAEGINLVVDLFGPGILGKAAKGVSKIPEASRNLVAATALNYGAKSRTLPTNIYKSRNLFINSPEGRWIKDSDPFVEFINSKRGIPFNTSFFLRTPKDINILNLRNGRYRAKAEGNVIVPSGNVDGKFVSYGEPWMEFGTNDLAAWYEFPTSIQRGGRGPHIMATDWRGNRMDYDVTEAWRNMMLRQDPKFIAEEKSMYENLRAQKFNSSQERVQAHRAARKAFYEKWGYNPDINLDVYHGNQTVIPSNRWNFNSEYPRGFLSQPFWRYTQDPYSGAVQKELMMNWESPMKTLDKTHADILPFIDPETGMWDYLTDFKVKSKSK